MPSPRDDSLFVPSRTAEHARTFVSWPCRPELWDDHLAEAELEYRATVEAIARFEPVTVIAPPGTQPSLPSGTTHAVDVAEIPIDDSWVRDNGPIFVVDGHGGVAAVNFGFNAWGGKFAPFAEDAQLPPRLAARLGMRVYDAPLVAEGGGLAFDGEGTLITTESVLLNPNRNPGLTRERAEELLGAYLGIEKVIWLAGGLVEDRDTDGHSDNVVQFVRPGVVLVQMAPDRSNPNWDLLRDNRARLEGETDAAGPHGSRSSRCRCCRTSRSPASASSCRTSTTSPSTAASSRRRSASRTTRRASRCCASCSPSARSWAPQPAARLRRRRDRLHHAADAGGTALAP